jgi:hypothetical protein
MIRMMTDYQRGVLWDVIQDQSIIMYWMRDLAIRYDNYEVVCNWLIKNKLTGVKLVDALRNHYGFSTRVMWDDIARRVEKDFHIQLKKNSNAV